VSGSSRFLLEYGGASRFGADSFTIDRAGAMRFEGTHDGERTIETTGAATPTELEKLANGLRSNRCCELRSERELGVPDEGHTHMRLGFDGLSCDVSLWDNE
jgi:hypothetical protein